MDSKRKSYMDSMDVPESYILGVSYGLYLNCDSPGFYSLSDTPEEICGKVINPRQSNPCFARYFMIDSGHNIYLVGAGLMAHDKDGTATGIGTETYWVADDIFKTDGHEDVDDFVDKEIDKFMVSPLFVCDVPKSISVYWDLLTDTQRKRATDAITRVAFHKMKYVARRFINEICSSGTDSDSNDDMTKLEDGVDALELNDSSHFEFDNGGLKPSHYESVKMDRDRVVQFEDVIMDLGHAVLKPGRKHAATEQELETVVNSLEGIVSSLKFECDLAKLDLSFFSRVFETMLGDLKDPVNVKGSKRDPFVYQVGRWYETEEMENSHLSYPSIN